jgi:ComF family protein
VAFRAFADTLLALLLAPPCAVCGRVLDQPLSGAVCEGCWSAIAACHSPFALRSIPQACAAGLYEGPLRDVIHALKYEGRRSIAPRLAELMVRHGAAVLRGADAVVPVPLHRWRHRQRGFNQADDLARGLGIPVVRALRRVRATPPQVDLTAAERRQNVHDAFAIGTRLHAPPLDGLVIVLVDDVATTGATLEACARVLTRAGARDVRALTAARVVTGGPPERPL